MNLTTVERVKDRIENLGEDTQYDLLLSTLLARVSAEASRMMNREVESKSRTVQRDVKRFMPSLSLRGYPVSSVTTIKNDTERLFGSGTEIEAENYYTDLESGLVHFETALTPGRGVLQIVYTGGMAADTDAFIEAYPDIADAIDQRVIQLFQRRNEIGVSSVGTAQGNISSQTIKWIPDSLEVINSYRRLGVD